MVVLPTPGGPQNTSEVNDPESSITPRGASAPNT